MFERIYARPRWHEALLSTGNVASVGIHLVACAAFLLRGVDPASVADQVNEGIVFLAPRPSPMAGPTTPAEQLRYVELSTTIAPMAIESDLHLGSKEQAETPQLEETALGSPVEVPASIFERQADSVYFAEQVDSPAAYDERSAAPVYPDSLQRLGVEGSVMAQFIIDTTGRVEMATVQLLESTNLRFTQSVLEALPRMLFRPAILNGQKARQIVEVPFRFRVVMRDTSHVGDTTSNRTRRAVGVRPPADSVGRQLPP